jgi:hypothetical protein
VLSVENRSTEEAQLFVEGVQVGVVKAGAQSTFGPLSGDPQKAQIEARTSTKGLLEVSRYADTAYDLGQPPVQLIVLSPQRAAQSPAPSQAP